ncbi:hypothetical protein RUM43_009835 [Polyplax serrata]|uniref:Mitochondrial basic amino acids transporter n=1 Tax=Polyplax serrata TaxID=468196 RepID=A0AAN8PJV8_POLSC
MALDFFAGCLGGCAGILVGHPLDTIKIRIQTQDFRNPLYKGTVDCFRKVVKQESILGLYKGMSSPLAGVAVINAVVFGVYGNIQKNLSDPESLGSCFISGAVAGLVQSFICSPMELVKSRMQIQTGKVSDGLLVYLKKIWRKDGMGGVFRGLNVTFLRESLGFGVYFSSYEWLTRSESEVPVSTVHLLLAGGSSGAASWLCTYPLDVVKSRIQIDGMSGPRQYKSSLDCLVKCTRREGYRFLFRGLGPTLIRAFPTNAATWAVVTWTMRLLEKPTEVPQAHVRTETFESKLWNDLSSNIYSYDYCFVRELYLKYLGDES